MNKRNRLTLAPVETGGLFRLQMTTTHVGDGAKGPSSDRARQALLISDFGSRKKQKMEVSRQANIVDVKAVAASSEVGQHLQAASLAAAAGRGASADSGDVRSTVGSKLEATLHDGRVATLPPFDASADTPEGAYPLSGIMSAEVFEALEPNARLILNAMEGGGDATREKTKALISKLSKESQHVTSRLDTLVGMRLQRKHSDKSAAAGAESGGIRRSAAKSRAGCLLFLAQLLQLHRASHSLHYRSPRTPATTSAEVPLPTDFPSESPGEPSIPALADMPPGVVTELLARYTEARAASGEASSVHPSYYVRTEELRDRLVAHAAVLALIVDGFTMDLRLLAGDLRLPLAKVSTMLREAGCTVEPVREGGTVVSYVATLKAPLVFPKLKYGRK